MKTNSFIIKPLLLLAVLSTTSLLPVQAASEKCSAVIVDPQLALGCTTGQIWVPKGRKIEYKAYQKNKRIHRGGRDYVKEIVIKKGQKVVKRIKPTKRKMGTGTYTVPSKGHYSITVYASPKGRVVSGKISNIKKSKKSKKSKK